MDSDQDFEILAPTTTEVVVQQPQPAAKPVECPIFSGGPRDTVADFIQAVQKYAFELKRSTDDKWITEYVATRLSGDAMLWYSGLPSKTRGSWDKLRAALATRFGPPPTVVYCDNASESGTETESEEEGSEVDEDDAPQNHRRNRRNVRFVGPPAPRFQMPPPMPPMFPTRPKVLNEFRGRIEVFIPGRNLWLGYLATSPGFGPEGTTFNVVGVKDNSLLVSFVISSNGDPVQLETMATTWHAPDMYRPYLGVALDDPESNNMTPPSMPGSFGRPYMPSYPIPSQAYPPSPMFNTAGMQPQRMIGQLPPIMPNGPHLPPVSLPPSTVPSPYAFQQPPRLTSSPTWSFKACTESSKDERRRRASKTTNIWEKAAAAVWAYDVCSKEMSVMWMNDDGSEEKLEVLVQKPLVSSDNVRLSLRCTKDVPSEATGGEARSALQEFPVKFFFVPED